MTVYLDNAATTPVDPVVINAMWPVMQYEFGNPSSIHQFGHHCFMQSALICKYELLHS